MSNYITQEEEMFSLYNFIQTVNAEIDTVIEATQQTEAEIKKFRGLSIFLSYHSNMEIAF